MAISFVCNEDLLIEAGFLFGPGDKVHTGQVGITHPAVTAIVSPTCKAVGKGICTTSLTYGWVVAGKDCLFTSPTYDFVAGGGSIAATGINILADGNIVILEEDYGPCVGTWKKKVHPFNVISCSCDLFVDFAGQTKVWAWI